MRRRRHDGRFYDIFNVKKFQITLTKFSFEVLALPAYTDILKNFFVQSECFTGIALTNANNNLYGTCDRSYHQR